MLVRSVDLADKNGFTPLMAAAMHGNLEMFRSASGTFSQSPRGSALQRTAAIFWEWPSMAVIQRLSRYRDCERLPP